MILSLFFTSKCSFTQNEFLKCFQNAVDQSDSTRFDEQKWIDCLKGKQLPDFEARTLSGRMIDSKDLKGKVVVINFWFIECHPCVAELPGLNLLVKEFKNSNVLFLGITYETKERLDSAFFPKYQFDFDIVPGASYIINKFGPIGYPTTFFIDKHGTINNVIAGGLSDKNAVVDVYRKEKPIIEELLKN